MKRFIKNILYFLLASLIPLIIVSIGYLYYDPFRVLKDYADYSYPHVIPNRDYISTEMFIKNFERRHYNSFIFGSSRTLAFKPSSWTKHLSGDAVPFMFDASSESIYGIYTKIRFLDSLRVPLKNAIILLCRDVSFDNEFNRAGHLFIKDPRTSGESQLAFQLAFYKAYLSSNFLFCYYSFKLSKQYKSFMTGYIENRKITYDTITNEINILDQEDEINSNPTDYFGKRKTMFYSRGGQTTDTVQRINANHLFMLNEIKRIFEKNRTDYKVIVSPLYEQIKFNYADLAILNNVFGNHFYDFAGKNIFTEDIHNFYETKHFRPIVGDSILNAIYK